MPLVAVRNTGAFVAGSASYLATHRMRQSPRGSARGFHNAGNICTSSHECFACDREHFVKCIEHFTAEFLGAMPKTAGSCWILSGRSVRGPGYQNLHFLEIGRGLT